MTSRELPSMPFMMEPLDEGGSSGRLYTLACHCTELSDMTLLYRRDETDPEPLPESLQDEVALWLKVDLGLWLPCTLLARTLGLNGPEPDGPLGRVGRFAVQFIDGLLGCPRRIFEVVRQGGKVIASPVTIYEPAAADLVIRALRRMKIPVVREEDEDWGVTLSGLPLAWDEVPLKSLVRWLLTGWARFEAQFYLSLGGELDGYYR